jgi:hypothetical protein
MYSRSQVEKILDLIAELGLRANDIHIALRDGIKLAPEVRNFYEREYLRATKESGVLAFKAGRDACSALECTIKKYWGK